jgi:hypothetical protein
MASGELPCHRPRETRHLVDLDIRQHPRAADGEREELVIDDDEGLEPGM